MDKLTSEHKFAIMPEWVIELPVSHTAFRLYAVLARYADNVTHQAFPSLDTLSERLGCSEKTVRRAIEDLVKHGAIKKHSRGRYQSTLYTVITTPPKGTKMTEFGTEMSDEGTNLSQRVDKNDQVTITTELEPIELEPLKTKKRNQRLPKDWVPSQKLLDLFATKWPDLDADYEVEQFCTYWWGNGGVKSNWDMAFRNWMNRNQKGFKPRVGRSDSERLRAEALAEIERENNE